jgi:hypothetical protein
VGLQEGEVVQLRGLHKLFNSLATVWERRGKSRTKPSVWEIGLLEEKPSVGRPAARSLRLHNMEGKLELQMKS